MNRSVGKVRGFDYIHMWYLQDVFLFVVCPSGLFRKSCWHSLVGFPSAGLSFTTGKEKKIQLLWSFLFAHVCTRLQSLSRSLYLSMFILGILTHTLGSHGELEACVSKYRETALLWILWLKWPICCILLQIIRFSNSNANNSTLFWSRYQ